MTVTRFSLPLVEPLSTADGSIERRDGFVVRLDHRDTVGIGEATPLPGWTETIGDCESALETGQSTYERQGYRAALAALEPDEVPATRNGIETALLDAEARADGVSLAGWLSSREGSNSPASTVPVNATVGDGTVDQTVEAARTAVDGGFGCLKLKVGVADVEHDIERVGAVRSAVGENVTLRVDANGAWDRETATVATDAFADLDVSYVEQPLDGDDLDGHAALRGRGVEIALDEGLYEHTVEAIAEANAADVLILKPMVVGGPGVTHTLAQRARALGLDAVVTTTIDGVVARTTAVHVAAAIPDVRPCGLATASYFADDLAPDPSPVEEGRITVPNGQGLGIDPDEVSP
jgi:o-succinylbenzoate synthase